MRDRSYPLLRKLKLAVGFLILLPWLMGTAPLQPPYYQYGIEGTLERLNGGQPVNFTVMLAAKYENDTAYQILRGGSGTNAISDRPIVLTDSMGRFSLVAMSNRSEVDSLAVAIIRPDQPILIVASFAVEKSDSHQEESRTYDSGCSCVTSPGTAYTAGYSYLYKDRRVVMP